MININNINLTPKTSSYGTIFYLTEKARIKHTEELSAEKIILQEHEDYIIFIGDEETQQDPSHIFNISLEKVNIFLDKISLNLGDNIRLKDPSDNYLLWWRGQHGLVLKIKTKDRKVETNLSIDPKGIHLLDKNNNDAGVNVENIENYHESLRYFRMCQTSDEIFDSFRNIYLALESILFCQYKNLEKVEEKEWLMKALLDISTRKGFSLKRFCLDQQTLINSEEEAAETLCKELYSEYRNPIFHAKLREGTTVLYPQDHINRSDIFEAITRYSNLYAEIYEQVYGIRRENSLVSGHFIAIGYRGILEGTNLVINDEIPYPPEHLSVTDKIERMGVSVCQSIKGKELPKEIKKIKIKNKNGESFHSIPLPDIIKISDLSSLKLMLFLEGGSYLGPRQHYIT